MRKMKGLDQESDGVQEGQSGINQDEVPREEDDEFFVLEEDDQNDTPVGEEIEQDSPVPGDDDQFEQTSGGSFGAEEIDPWESKTRTRHRRVRIYRSRTILPSPSTHADEEEEIEGSKVEMRSSRPTFRESSSNNQVGSNRSRNQYDEKTSFSGGTPENLSKRPRR